MKASILIVAVLTSLAAISFTSCNFSIDQKAETLEKAKADVEVATRELEMAREDSADYANYKIVSEIKLRENELLIADMKDKMKSGKRESVTKYEKQLDSLDWQNSRLRTNMRMYRAEGRAKWELFKRDFNMEMDALGKSISRMAEKNMKKNS
jgi:predicted  nucleic acid-binding Zn-ribbon protein